MTSSRPLFPPQREAQRVGSRAHWLNMANPATALARAHPGGFTSRYRPDEPRKGADVLVEALEREGVDVLFAYPGGASMEIHQALTRADSIRNILCRHEQGEIFAAEGYAKSSGRVGVCIATSGPGATNLVTGLADAMLDSVPLVAITGQVPRRLIGTDAFQETPIVEISRQITKHNYLVTQIEDIPRIMREAFFLASSGRPGPVLVDVPKDIQQQLTVPDWNPKLSLGGYMSRLPGLPPVEKIAEIIMRVKAAKRPVVYAGGGCLHASHELKEFVRLTGIPVVQTLMVRSRDGAAPVNQRAAGGAGRIGVGGVAAVAAAWERAAAAASSRGAEASWVGALIPAHPPSVLPAPAGPGRVPGGGPARPRHARHARCAPTPRPNPPLLYPPLRPQHPLEKPPEAVARAAAPPSAAAPATA